jgi:hypothetical protein
MFPPHIEAGRLPAVWLAVYAHIADREELLETIDGITLLTDVLAL